MYYKCPDCGKIINEYSKKCPECGSKISLSDTASEESLENLETSEDFEAKMNLLHKRIVLGYVYFILLLILTVVLCIFFLFNGVSIKIFPFIIIGIDIIAVIILLKLHFLCCPYCDNPLHREDIYYHQYCPHCGSVIKYNNYSTKRDK